MYPRSSNVFSPSRSWRFTMSIMSIIFIMGAILMVSLLLLVLPTSALERQEPAAGWLARRRSYRANKN
ncbi:hypothetical protein HBH64_233010 [Parastagonospora nodorum]|nr:hypothetical protein HBI10_193870 [Parastagonospora nodorum]KAH4008735.1 hypothetical protein HBI13_232100 [Parastagonospora nodorum]KAH4153339.1 hypothetical protein HBH43_224670 [Parastagonospora nodorum]KAH4285240.1 hypothetical protein HBI02_232490 [Parastagonospora nodorum]KAH4286199.1 hypothetical protein HBI01_240350 [Parastagonospora nodorum]